MRKRQCKNSRFDFISMKRYIAKSKSSAIVLCSGGIDSVVTAFYAKKKLRYRRIIMLFFDYGQKALKQERICSKRCSKNLGAKFMEIELKWLNGISNSLINKKGRIKQLKKMDLKDTKKESQKWYVPCRNTIFLAHALALAESLFMKEKKAYDIFVGFKCEGREAYPDTTHEFVEEMNRLSRISCAKPFRIIAPLIKKDKEDIILLGEKLGVNFRNTISCYAPKRKNGLEHCGYCLACRLRQAGFYWADIKDETRYENKLQKN